MLSANSGIRAEGLRVNTFTTPAKANRWLRTNGSTVVLDVEFTNNGTIHITSLKTSGG